MSDNDFKIEAPIKMTMQIVVKAGDGQYAEIGYDLPAMRIPTKDEVWQAIEEAIASPELEAHQLSQVSKKEMFDYIVRERTGTNMTLAMPGNSDWD